MATCANIAPPHYSLTMGFFGVLFISSFAVNAMSRDVSSLVRLERSGSKRYCGHDISNVLQLICKSEYNPYFKRNEMTVRSSNGYKSHSGSGSSKDSSCQDKDDQIPLMTRREALAALGRRLGRQTRGVADECCRKGCTLDELSAYCAEAVN